MNLNDFRTRVARVTGMSTSNSSDLALIDSWANEAVLQFLRDTKMHVLPASVAVTAGTDDYTLDANILSLTELWYNPATGEDVLMDPVSPREMTRMRLLTDAGDQAPRYYSLEGAHLLRIHPAPVSSSDTMHLLYVPRPSSSLAATADTPSATAAGGIPSEYHPVLEAYIKWKAAEAEEHKPSENGLQFQAEYELGISRARADVNRKSGVVRARARWGHIRRYPVTPGTDVKY